MKLTLNENIRKLRKERKMTQEKLAEVLGVTVGAVHKWETGMSLPELELIVEMADFFDTSVDVLLGYEMKDNCPDHMLERIVSLCMTFDPAAIAEAEKALGKYPNSFDVVYTCAEIFLAYGSGNHDAGQLGRALDLYEQSIVLLPQNTNPCINKSTIGGEMSLVMFLLDEREKSLELLKKNNAGGIFNEQIGTYLAAYMGRTEEAVPFLSRALAGGVSTILSTVFGYVFVFRERNDINTALDITSWGLKLLNGLKTGSDKPDVIDKTQAQMLALLAYVQKTAGLLDESSASLRSAADAAKRFDSDPDYSLKQLRFADKDKQTVIFDVFGISAADSVATMIDLFDDKELSERWKEIVGNER